VRLVFERKQPLGKIQREERREEKKRR